MVSQLPIPKSIPDLTHWKSIIDPVTTNPANNTTLLKNIVLKTGVNTINHGLGQALQGYIVVIKSANVTIYDNQSTNQLPNLTLILVASGPCTISLLVF